MGNMALTKKVNEVDFFVRIEYIDTVYNNKKEVDKHEAFKGHKPLQSRVHWIC